MAKLPCSQLVTWQNASSKVLGGKDAKGENTGHDNTGYVPFPSLAF